MKKLCYLLSGFLLVFLCTSACDQRDPQAEYEQIRDAVYSSPKTGIDVAQEYIDHFHSKNGNRVNEVSEIQEFYRLMDNFFSNSFRSYQEFMNQSKGLNEELSYCNYDGVRNTWKNLYGQERNRLLAPLMEGITDQTFDSFFKTQVRFVIISLLPGISSPLTKSVFLHRWWSVTEPSRSLPEFIVSICVAESSDSEHRRLWYPSVGG